MNNTTSQNCVIGIDVSKAALDSHLLPDESRARFDNTPEGHERLVAWAGSHQLQRIVLEASGGYELPVVAALASAGLPAAARAGQRDTAARGRVRPDFSLTNDADDPGRHARRRKNAGPFCIQGIQMGASFRPLHVKMFIRSRPTALSHRPRVLQERQTQCLPEPCRTENHDPW